jgi:hypothetical protein
MTLEPARAPWPPVSRGWKVCRRSSRINIQGLQSILGGLPCLKLGSCPKEAMRPNYARSGTPYSGSDRREVKVENCREPNHLRHVPRLSFKRSSVRFKWSEALVRNWFSTWPSPKLRRLKQGQQFFSTVGDGTHRESFVR